MSETLTAMLMDRLPTMEEDAKSIKTVFKDWLRTVDTGPDMGRDEFRRMLITLVDEPR